MPKNRNILNNIAIVLLKPKFPENIGAAARSAWNMGISHLVVVRSEQPDHHAMAKMATHKAVHLIDSMALHTSLSEALAPFSIIIGTTARKGRQRLTKNNPRQIVEKVLPLLPDNKIAFLFGPEDCGLTNDDLKYCHMTSSIPTADFSSLNLAQAVAIHCYEIYHGLVHSQQEFPTSQKLATSFELEGMYTHVEEALLQVNFLHEKNHTYWMRNIRDFLARRQLSSKDSNIIRGICRQFLWYQSQSHEKHHNTG